MLTHPSLASTWRFNSPGDPSLASSSLCLSFPDSFQLWNSRGKIPEGQQLETS